MDSSRNFATKEQITHAIFTGAVVMLLVFVISLFLPKQWLVSGKIVVFPTGNPASASVNLLPEVGNTASFVRSQSFQKNYFADQAQNFAGVKALKRSSIVEVKFRSGESDIQATEDLIVKIPSQISEYTRDLYDGVPFKYKMAADPEISKSPVRPNLLLNAVLGFVAGVILYLIYALYVYTKPDQSEEIEFEEKIVSPEIKEEVVEKEEKVGEGKVEMINGRPHFVPSKNGAAETSAPENLPFVDEAASSNSENIQEPSDEEVKDRLNRLMRGEL